MDAIEVIFRTANAMERVKPGQQAWKMFLRMPGADKLLTQHSVAPWRDLACSECGCHSCVCHSSVPGKLIVFSNVKTAPHGYTVSACCRHPRGASADRIHHVYPVL